MNSLDPPPGVSQARHTPGPWKARKSAIETSDGDQPWIVQDAEYLEIASLSYTLGPEGREEADARLIAAAPELLAALMDLTDIAERIKHFNYTHDDLVRMLGPVLQPARAASRKAEQDA